MNWHHHHHHRRRRRRRQQRHRSVAEITHSKECSRVGLTDVRCFRGRWHFYGVVSRVTFPIPSFLCNADGASWTQMENPTRWLGFFLSESRRLSLFSDFNGSCSCFQWQDEFNFKPNRIDIQKCDLAVMNLRGISTESGE